MESGIRLLLIILLVMFFYSCHKKQTASFSKSMPYQMQNTDLEKEILTPSLNQSWKKKQSKSHQNIVQKHNNATIPVSKTPQKMLTLRPNMEKGPLAKNRSKITSGDLPFNFQKHSNAFWIIGGVLFVSGLGIFLLALTLGLKIARGDGKMFLWGILIGLGFIVLSLPLILTGAIIS